jgi:hypothetical protein
MPILKKSRKPDMQFWRRVGAIGEEITYTTGQFLQMSEMQYIET